MNGIDASTPGPIGRVAIMGVGRMGAAIASALGRDGGGIVDEVVGSEPDPDFARQQSDALGIEVVADPAGAVTGAQVVVVAVKPHLVGEVLASIGPSLSPGAVVASVAAGITTSAMEDSLPPGSRVVRVMPNTPMLVGRGMAVVTGGRHADDEDVAVVARLMGAAAEVLVLPETQFDAVTGVSGSGPAWVFALAEAMVAGAEDVGLDRDDAIVLVERTVAGAGHLLATSDRTAGELREMVSSPGGTTVAGLQALDVAGFSDAVRAAITAATGRSRDLGA